MGTDFVPYRGCDMRHEPGGYVQIHVLDYGPVWARLERLSGMSADGSVAYNVKVFGWGCEPRVIFSELSAIDQHMLLLREEIRVLEGLLERAPEILKDRAGTWKEIEPVSTLIRTFLCKLEEAAKPQEAPPMRMAHHA